jgi:hypothetical protein
MSNAIERIEGTIKMEDGTVSSFSIHGDNATWLQWGANNTRLGLTSQALSDMADAARPHMFEMDTPEPETYRLALLVGVHRDHIDQAGEVLSEAGYGWFRDGTGWQVWSEPVDADGNDGVTYLVDVEVESLVQGRAVATMLDQAGMLTVTPSPSPDWQMEKIAAATGDAENEVIGYVTNAETYCEGSHHAIVRGSDPIDLLA